LEVNEEEEEKEFGDAGLGRGFRVKPLLGVDCRVWVWGSGVGVTSNGARAQLVAPDHCPGTLVAA